MEKNIVLEKYIQKYKKSYEKNVLIIMVGVPGSGKTTVSKFLEMEGVAKISTDDLKGFYDNECYEIKDLFKLQHQIIKALMKRNKCIVADSNSDKEIYRTELRRLAYNCSYTTVIIYCYANKETIYKRMDERKKVNKFYVEPNRIDQFIDELEIPFDSVNINTNLDISETKKKVQELVNKIKNGGKS